MDKKRVVVVTGIGIVNPSGIGKEDFWESVVEGKVSIKDISRFDSEKYPVKVAGEITDFNPRDYVPKRMVNKTDRFTHYALSATDMALKDSGFNITEDNEYRCGIFLGNNSGGWDICEKGFYELYNDGADMVNPWQASAWFPAAAQGYMAIRYGIKGRSKTFVADRISGSSALYFAISSILNEKNDMAVVGGTEAPITPFGVCCYYESGELSTSAEPDKSCRPFAKDSSGIVLGEGSTILILEELEEAKKRGAKIYGEITGWAMNVGESDDYSSMEKCIKDAISKGGLEKEDIDLLVPEGNGAKTSDYAEKMAVDNIWGKESKKLKTIIPKALFGHLYGAASATDVACGLMAMNSDKLPAFKNTYESESDTFRVLNLDEKGANINNVLVNSRSREGVNISFVLSKYAQEI